MEVKAYVDSLDLDEDKGKTIVEVSISAELKVGEIVWGEEELVVWYIKMYLQLNLKYSEGRLMYTHSSLSCWLKGLQTK